MRKINFNIDLVESKDKSSGSLSEVSVFADEIDLLRSRAHILNGKDRALMKMYFEKGSSFSQIAKLAGVNEVTISRRVHKLTRRLVNSEYISFVRNRRLFNPQEQAIARDHYVMGLAQKQIAEKRKTSVYRVRKVQKRIQRLIKTYPSG
jgi:DNA-directed RNA polymerase specialized sigma subunit